MSSLFDIIKRDAKAVINNGGYQLDIEFTSKDGSKTVNIKGWAVKVSGSFDSDGNQVNTKNAHVTIDEDSLTKLDYPVRSFRKKIAEIDLINHRVSFADSSGNVAHYTVRENIPDENLGLILLWLQDYYKQD